MHYLSVLDLCVHHILNHACIVLHTYIAESKDAKEQDLADCTKGGDAANDDGANGDEAKSMEKTQPMNKMDDDQEETHEAPWWMTFTPDAEYVERFKLNQPRKISVISSEMDRVKKERLEDEEVSNTSMQIKMEHVNINVEKVEKVGQSKMESKIHNNNVEKVEQSKVEKVEDSKSKAEKVENEEDD